ncbi:MAG: aminoacyl-tRNA hydrolase [bacterium]|nr:aminoacyl-tRNA hydrolase [bacterium]
MKLIVGLGNPGSKYEQTRHNVGFVVLSEIAKREGANVGRDRFHGETREVKLGDEPALLLAPMTFMNLSGKSVVAARDFYKIEASDIFVICDDFSLPLGKLRVRKKGSSGGQKGLGDIINRLGTNEIPRLRIGIDPPPARWDVADYVLSKFKKDEQSEIELAIMRAADAVSAWAKNDIDYCMNQYNPE